MSDLTVPQRKERLLAELRLLSITKVVIEYAGSGDSGQVDTISAYTADNDKPQEVDEIVRRVAPPDEIVQQVATKLQDEKHESLHDQLDQFAYDALAYVDASDWYNNEGGGGTMTWNVESGDIEFAHYYYTQQTHEEIYSL